MATAEWLAENPQVIGYVPRKIHELLQTFKAERSLKSFSQALIAILGEYLGQEQKSHNKAESGEESQLARSLERRIEALEQMVSQLTGVNTALVQALSSAGVQQLPASKNELGVEQADVPAPEKGLASPALETSITQYPASGNSKSSQIKDSLPSKPFVSQGIKQTEEPAKPRLLLPAAKAIDPLEGISTELGIDFQAIYHQSITELIDQRSHQIPDNTPHSNNIQEGLEALLASNYFLATETFTQALKIISQSRNVTQFHKISNQQAFLYCCRGMALCRLNLADAVEDFTKAIKIESQSSTAYFYRGITLTKLGNLDEALNDYLKALSSGIEIARQFADIVRAKLDERDPYRRRQLRKKYSTRQEKN